MATGKENMILLALYTVVVAHTIVRFMNILYMISVVWLTEQIKIIPQVMPFLIILDTCLICCDSQSVMSNGMRQE